MAGARLRGKANANGAQTFVRFWYRPVGGDDTSWVQTPDVDAGSGTADFLYTHTLSSLSSGTPYEYYAEGTNGGGTRQGATVQFITLGTLPSLPAHRDPDCAAFNPGGSDGSAGRNYTDGVSWHDKVRPDRQPFGKFGPGALPGSLDPHGNLRGTMTPMSNADPAYFGDIVISLSATNGGINPYIQDYAAPSYSIPAGTKGTVTTADSKVRKNLGDLEVWGNVDIMNRNSTTNTNGIDTDPPIPAGCRNLIIRNRNWDPDWPRKLEAGFELNPTSGHLNMQTVDFDFDQLEVHYGGSGESNLGTGGQFALTERRYPIYYLAPVLASNGTTLRKPTSGLYRLTFTWYDYTDTAWSTLHTHKTAAIAFDATPEAVQVAVMEAVDQVGSTGQFRNHARVEGGALQTNAKILERTIARYYRRATCAVTGHDHDQYRDVYSGPRSGLQTEAIGAKYGITFRAYSKGANKTSMSSNFHPLAGCNSGVAVQSITFQNDATDPLKDASGNLIIMDCRGTYSGAGAIPAPYAFDDCVSFQNSLGLMQRFFINQHQGDAAIWNGYMPSGDNVLGSPRSRYGCVVQSADRELRFAGRSIHNDGFQSLGRVDQSEVPNTWTDAWTGTVHTGLAYEPSCYAVAFLSQGHIAWFTGGGAQGVGGIHEVKGATCTRCIFSGSAEALEVTYSDRSGAEDCWFNRIPDEELSETNLVTGRINPWFSNTGNTNTVWSGNQWDDGTAVSASDAGIPTTKLINGDGQRTPAQGYNNALGQCASSGLNISAAYTTAAAQAVVTEAGLTDKQYPWYTRPTSNPSVNGWAIGDYTSVSVDDWFPGFWCGVLWELHLRNVLHGDATPPSGTTWQDQARSQQTRIRALISGGASTWVDSNLGFLFWASLGRGVSVDDTPANVTAYLSDMGAAATTMATKFVQFTGTGAAGVLRGTHGDVSANPLTIIDVTLSAELLIWNTIANSGSTTHRDKAIDHARHLAANHMRTSGIAGPGELASYHQTRYNADGTVNQRIAGAGLDATVNSCWARGQAWALAAFTMFHRYTKTLVGNHPTNGQAYAALDSIFLNTAEGLADFWCNHVPADGVPWWDFANDPAAQTQRDTSAAAVASEALLELSGFMVEQSDTTRANRYKTQAVATLTSLVSPTYFGRSSKLGDKSILSHARGPDALSTEAEKDRGTIWGDYYFLRALNRLAASS